METHQDPQAQPGADEVTQPDPADLEPHLHAWAVEAGQVIEYEADHNGHTILDWVENPVDHDLDAMLITLGRLRRAVAGLRAVDDSLTAAIYKIVGFTGQKGRVIDGVGKVTTSVASTTTWNKPATLRLVGVIAAQGDVDEGERVAAILARALNAQPNFSVTGLRDLGVDVGALRDVTYGRPRVDFVPTLVIVTDVTPDPAEGAPPGP